MDICMLLLQEGADISIHARRSCVGLLITAIHEKKDNIVKLLLDKGADSAVDIWKSTPLLLAKGRDYEDIVWLLLDEGADANAHSTADMWRTTPLLSAIERNQDNIVKLLLDKGADVNAQSTVDMWKTAPLLSAIGRNQEDIVRLLLDKGADANAHSTADMWKTTPLLSAIERNQDNIVKLLLDKGADVNTRGSGGTTPLLSAIERNHDDIVKLLLDKGADANAQSIADMWKAIPLLLAIVRKKDNTVKLLLDKGADTNTQSTAEMWKTTPLLSAIERNQDNIVKLLLDKGADVNSQGRGDTTPLLLAINQKNTDIVKLLLDKGADFNTQVRGTTTALLLAINRNQDNIARLLLNKGLNLYSLDRQDNIALLSALDQTQDNYFELLLGKRANNNIRHWRGSILLLSAIKRHQNYFVKLLHDEGVHVNAQGTDDTWKTTPLLLAMERNQGNIVKLLLDKGANIDNLHWRDKILFLVFIKGKLWKAWRWIGSINSKVHDQYRYNTRSKGNRVSSKSFKVNLLLNFLLYPAYVVTSLDTRVQTSKLTLRSWYTAIVIYTRLRGIVRKAVVGEVNLIHAIDKDRYNRNHRASCIRFRNGNNGVITIEIGISTCARSVATYREGRETESRTESHLLRGYLVRTLHDLDGEMGGKWHNLARYERVTLLIARGTEGGSFEESRQVEGGEDVQNDDLVRGVRVDGVVEGEVGVRVVEGQVQRRRCIELLVKVVLVIDEVLLREQSAERRIANGVGFIRAHLQHRNGVRWREIERSGDLQIMMHLRVQASQGRIKRIRGKYGRDRAANATSTGYVGRLDQDLNADLVHILGNAQEIRGKLLGRSDHAILTLSPEDKERAAGGEVVQQLAIQLTVGNAQLEVLAPAKRGEDFRSQTIPPAAQEDQFPRSG
ncbi:hypothetical protein BP5796_12813 [Coleophoma crateriformis]|uniref:Uncharacterized protein n=1 Tax=Coleophoma crateriformis TaxID=565419 RepID=A0A3D8Q6B2_9HELO|nr:hypothetical protein BP5796_12813 [Coleophoma crateriformis]